MRKRICAPSMPMRSITRQKPAPDSRKKKPENTNAEPRANHTKNRTIILESRARKGMLVFQITNPIPENAQKQKESVSVQPGTFSFSSAGKEKSRTDRNAASDNQKRPDAARLRSSQYTDECGKVWRTHGDPSGERKVYLVWVSADAALSPPPQKISERIK